MDDDLQHLRLLSIFHYVVAGIIALFGLFPVFHVVFGILMLTGALKESNSSPGASPGAVPQPVP